MNAAWQRSAMTEVFADCHKFLLGVSGSFCHRYGGDYSDAFGEACSIFVERFFLFQKDERSEYSTASQFRNYMKFEIWKGLMAIHRKAIARNKLLRRIGNPVEDIDPPDKRIGDRTLQEWLEELSDDAAIVVKLALELPPKLNRKVKEKGNQPRNVRSVIQNFLRSSGWTVRRVTESFREIRRALQGI